MAHHGNLLQKCHHHSIRTSANLLERPEAGLNGAVSLADAINKQLGLRLENRKRVIPAVVIDHMELTPTEK